MAEAEKVFRQYQAAFIKWQQRGGSSTLPSEFNEFAAGESLEGVANLLAREERTGWRLAASPSPIISVGGASIDVPRGNADVVITGCVDGSRARVIQADGSAKAGVILQYRAFFQRIGGSLKEVDELTRQARRC